jgi:very-short-patch-repair endonuclease
MKAERGTRSRRKPGTTALARSLRWTENTAEGLLWQELKARRLGGHHFTRQFPTGPYFADFCCRRKRLVVEVDGRQHATSQRDGPRDAFMRDNGYSVLRFWNADVLNERSAVCETILAVLAGRLHGHVNACDLRFAYAPVVRPRA